MPFSDHNLELGEDAVNHVIALLEKFGYKVKRNELSREFSKSILTPEQAGELHRYPGASFDLFIGTKGRETAYLAQIKGKAKDYYKDMVDKVAYDGYYAIASLPFPFLYFIWIRETDKIYRHEITSPENFETREDIYLIPDDLIHLVQLNEDILLSASMSEESLMKALTAYSGVKLSYYQKHKERILARIKAYNETHKEQIKTYRADYYKANKEQIKATHKVYDDNHREQKRARDKAYSKARYAKYKIEKL